MGMFQNGSWEHQLRRFKSGYTVHPDITKLVTQEVNEIEIVNRQDF
jgi:hypothetical protein